jgi:hypothetical protein
MKLDKIKETKIQKRWCGLDWLDVSTVSSIHRSTYVNDATKKQKANGQRNRKKGTTCRVSGEEKKSEEKLSLKKKILLFVLSDMFFACWLLKRDCSRLGRSHSFMWCWSAALLLAGWDWELGESNPQPPHRSTSCSPKLTLRKKGENKEKKDQKM